VICLRLLNSKNLVNGVRRNIKFKILPFTETGAKPLVVREHIIIVFFIYNNLKINKIIQDIAVA